MSELISLVSIEDSLFHFLDRTCPQMKQVHSYRSKVRQIYKCSIIQLHYHTTNPEFHSNKNQENMFYQARQYLIMISLIPSLSPFNYSIHTAMCDTPFTLELVGNSFPVAGLPSSSRIKTPFSIPVTAQIGIYEYVQFVRYNYDPTMRGQ